MDQIGALREIKREMGQLNSDTKVPFHCTIIKYFMLERKNIDAEVVYSNDVVFKSV
jgi:hypothetical protein